MKKYLVFSAAIDDAELVDGLKAARKLARERAEANSDRNNRCCLCAMCDASEARELAEGRYEVPADAYFAATVYYGYERFGGGTDSRVATNSNNAHCFLAYNVHSVRPVR